MGGKILFLTKPPWDISRQSQRKDRLLYAYNRFVSSRIWVWSICRSSLQQNLPHGKVSNSPVHLNNTGIEHAGHLTLTAETAQVLYPTHERVRNSIFGGEAAWRVGLDVAGRKDCMCQLGSRSPFLHPPQTTRFAEDMQPLGICKQNIWALVNPVSQHRSTVISIS